MPTEYDVILASVPDDKEIPVVKIIYRVLGLSAKEAKNLVKSLPKTVMERVSKPEAETFQRELEQAGAKVNLKKIAGFRLAETSQPPNAVELDEVAVLNKYYSALTSLDSKYQELLKARIELNWYECKLREANELARQLGIENTSKLSVAPLASGTPLVRSLVESVLTKARSQVAEHGNIQRQRDETISRLQKELNETLFHLRQQRDETISRLQQEFHSTISRLKNRLQTIESDINYINKSIDSIKTKQMVEVLLIIGSGIITVIFVKNFLVVIGVMFTVWLIRMNQN